jgi:hypothetical protein
MDIKNQNIYINMNLFNLLFFDISLGDFAKQTRIHLLILSLHLINYLVHEVINLIIILFVENRECMCSNKTLGQNIKKNLAIKYDQKNIH